MSTDNAIGAYVLIALASIALGCFVREHFNRKIAKAYKDGEHDGFMRGVETLKQSVLGR